MNENTTIGHYKILNPLGKGGMGEVYLAEDTRLDRQVAIKVLPETLRSNLERLARFRREAKAAAGLKHPNIAAIHTLEEMIRNFEQSWFIFVQLDTFDHLACLGRVDTIHSTFLAAYR